MNLPQRVEDWLTLLGLVAIGIVLNVVLGTALLYVFELLGLWPVAMAVSDDALSACRGATAGPATGLVAPGFTSVSGGHLDGSQTAA